MSKPCLHGAHLLWACALAAACIWGCALSVAPTSSQESSLTLELTVYPARVTVDSTATAEVWATLKQGDRPVKDSTVVAFATTVGTITSTSSTKDGLAVATLTGPGDGRPRRGQVVAQALTVRDTLDVDFVLSGE
jgi:hypothetical protein